MKLPVLITLFLLLLVGVASAYDVQYKVETYALDANNISFTSDKDYAKSCDDLCKFSIDVSLPDGSTFQEHRVSYPSNDVFKAEFESTDSKTTTKVDDRVVVDIIKEAPTCNQNQCGSGCVKCSDKLCHEPGFVCKEELSIDKVVPTSLQLGETQVNVLLRNTGTVNIQNIAIEISGDGISTIEKIPINSLVAGDKDYAFTKIRVTKPGTVDAVVSVVVLGTVKSKFIQQFTVAGSAEMQPQYNTTQLTALLSELKTKFRQLEQDYQDKTQQGYAVSSLIADDLRDADDSLKETQSFLLESNYKRVQSNLIIINDSLTDIEQQIGRVQKQEKPFAQKIKDNLLFIGSLAAALVSILTAWKLMGRAVDKEKIKELHEKLRRKNAAGHVPQSQVRKKSIKKTKKEPVKEASKDTDLP